MVSTALSTNAPPHANSPLLVHLVLQCVKLVSPIIRARHGVQTIIVHTDLRLPSDCCKTHCYRRSPRSGRVFEDLSPWRSGGGLFGQAFAIGDGGTGAWGAHLACWRGWGGVGPWGLFVDRMVDRAAVVCDREERVDGGEKGYTGRSDISDQIRSIR